MRKRRRKQGAASDLVELPWQVSAVLAIVGFAVVRWIMPALLSGPFLTGLRPMFGSLSWIALAAFGFISLLAFLRAKAASSESRALSRPELKRESRVSPSNPWPPELPLAPGVAVARSVTSTSPQLQNQPDVWSLEALRALEWKRFELLCARYYELVGFQTETLPAGPDGGIDIKLFKLDSSKPLAIVQCKAWASAQVGVKEVRELLGVMAHEKVGRGIFLTTSTYTRDAQEFGNQNPLQLLDGPTFMRKLCELPKEKQDDLLAFAFSRDYTTPTCPSCGVKLIVREGKRGEFWGCRNYPKCRGSLPLRAAR